MAKKKKTVKSKVKAKAKSRPKAKARPKARPRISRIRKAASVVKVVPIMGYRVSRVSKSPKGPRLTKSPLGKSDLNVFKKILSEMKKKIVRNIRAIEDENLNTSQKDLSGDLSGYGVHMADVATDSFDREINIGLAANKQQLLNDVEVALKKIEEGTFGICEKYGVAIPKKRLMAAPYVRFCLQAQEEEEKEPRRS